MNYLKKLFNYNKKCKVYDNEYNLLKTYDSFDEFVTKKGDINIGVGYIEYKNDQEEYRGGYNFVKNCKSGHGVTKSLSDDKIEQGNYDGNANDNGDCKNGVFIEYCKNVGVKLVKYQQNTKADNIFYDNDDSLTFCHGQEEIASYTKNYNKEFLWCFGGDDEIEVEKKEQQFEKLFLNFVDDFLKDNNFDTSTKYYQLMLEKIEATINNRKFFKNNQNKKNEIFNLINKRKKKVCGCFCCCGGTFKNDNEIMMMDNNNNNNANISIDSIKNSINNFNDNNNYS